jgi:acetylglutamate kinase
VRRGERVLQASSWHELDLPRLRELVESAFGRRLAADYFERTALLRASVSENYRAAVILTDEGGRLETGAPYLDKFAVLDDAQGEGLGRAVWQVMRERTPRLFWRSRRGNPVNPFYFGECDGCIKQPHWKVFWYGFSGFDDIARCVEHCRTRPATLEEPA